LSCPAHGPDPRHPFPAGPQSDLLEKPGPVS